MALRSPIDHYAPEEYLALERAAEFKSEYIDGEIVAMTGGSRAHSLIAGNVLGELRSALREQPCEVHGSDLRVTVEVAALYTYPDVTVICGEPVFEDEAEDTVMNPVVIVEVLSPSTEAYDRGKKFARFRLLPSLRAYILVSQDQPRVEWYTLGEDGWLLHEANGLDGTIQLTALNATLALAEIYAKVRFDVEPPRS
jgi:Uma2 family endonuclease